MDPAREAALQRISKEGTNVNTEFRRARSMMLDGRFDEAARLCRSAINMYPDYSKFASHDAVPYLGEILLQKGDIQGAIGEFSSYQDPGSQSTTPEIQASLALCYFKTGDIDDAQAVLLASAKASPDRLYTLLGDEHTPDLSVEDADTIEATCLLVRGTGPTDDLRIAKVKLEDLKLAKKRLPSNKGVDWLIGRAEFDLHDYAEAVKAWAPIMMGKDAFLNEKVERSYAIALERMPKPDPAGK